MSARPAPIPVFSWFIDEGTAYSDGQIQARARRKLVLDDEGWDWLRAQVSDRVAALLLELARLSVLDPARGARVVELSQEELAARIGRGQRGWGTDTVAGMLRSLVRAGLISVERARPLGPSGGSRPAVLVLQAGLFTPAAEHGPALLEAAAGTLPGALEVSSNPAPTRHPENPGVGIEPVDTPVPAFPTLADPQGRVTPDRAGGLGSGFAGTGVMRAPQDKTLEERPFFSEDPVAGALVRELRRLGIADAARLVPAHDPAWLAAWIAEVLADPAVGSPGGYLRTLIDPRKRPDARFDDPPGWVAGTTVALEAGRLVLTRPALPAVEVVTAGPGGGAGAVDPAVEDAVAALAHFHGVSDPNQARIWRHGARVRAAALAELSEATGLGVEGYLVRHLPERTVTAQEVP